MRKALAVVLAVLLQITICVGVVSPAEKTKKSRYKQTLTPKKRPAAPPYLNISFDSSIQKIPVPYFGHDIEQVYKGFNTRKETERKDEFDTTEQYQRRSAEQAGKPIFGSVSQDSILAFVVNPSSEYDADSQTLTISLKTSVVWQSFTIDESRLAVYIKRGEMTKLKSIGQNAYGAKVEIETTHAKRFELAIHNISNFETEEVLDEYQKESRRRMLEMSAKYNLPETSFKEKGKIVFVKRFKMGLEEARAVKGKIAALILAKPIAPYISYGEIYRGATFSNPTEFFSQMYYVDVDLFEIWIYDKISGEIISKIKGE